MKKLYFIFFIVFFASSALPLRSQVFGYPGATWVFHLPPFFGFCSSVYEKWEYIGDTTILGENAKNVHVSRASSLAWDTTVFMHSNFNRFYKINGDTVFLLNADIEWQELYNFSLQTGDTTFSPIRNIYCDSLYPQLYNFPAVVSNHGLDTIDGQSLRFYTLKYRTSTGPGDDFSDTLYAYQTFYERFITIQYWYPPDWFSCNATDACITPDLMCYRDNGMMVNSICSDLNWFETISIEEESSESAEKLYPNPADDILMVESNNLNNAKYSVLSIDGKLLLGSLQSPINISALPSGLYIITNETHTWFKKFIKD